LDPSAVEEELPYEAAGGGRKRTPCLGGGRAMWEGRSRASRRPETEKGHFPGRNATTAQAPWLTGTEMRLEVGEGREPMVVSRLARSRWVIAGGARDVGLEMGIDNLPSNCHFVQAEGEEEGQVC
jgi:hypothetical protein